MASTLGAHNPLRYRGYVYDTETTLYYLQSRYYDPELGRFINSDVLVSTGQGILGNNMFAYCLNNPVRYIDSEGQEATESCYSDDPRDDMFPKVDGAPISPTNGAQQNSQTSGLSSGRTYSAPPGGGGVSHSITVGSTTVTFGHGGGHMGGNDISQVESFIANDVVTRPPSPSHCEHVTVDYYGARLNYGYFTRSDILINVGTYFFPQVTEVCK